MKILIPMGGLGKRFLAKGYTIPKPLLEVDGMPVVEHVVNQFDKDKDFFVFGANEAHLKESNLRDALARLAPSQTIVSVPYQKAGPLGTLRKMFPHAKDEEPVIVNYCDFSWVWNYQDFKHQVSQNQCDGAVVCYRGFHPHLLGPNFYATLDANGLWMKELREKYSWHTDKTDDWSSSGTYYFRNAALLKKYCEKIETRPEWKIAGEFYVSQLFQLMAEDGLRIFIYEIPFMLQWGTPEDFEEYRYWSDFFRKKLTENHFPEKLNMTVLILMAGAGKRFADAGYPCAKPFIEIEGEPMVIGAAESLPEGDQTLFLSRKEIASPAMEDRIRGHFRNVEFLYLDRLTEGQASTALEAKPRLDPSKALLIGACDHRILYDETRFKQMTAEASGVDALILTFRNYPPVQRNPSIYGWVKTNGSGQVLKVQCKVPLEGDPLKHHAIIGSFWFRRAEIFIRCAEEMICQNDRIRGEFYIDHCMNYAVQKGFRVGVFEVEKYISWGTPEDVKTYEYWQRFFDQALFHPYKMEGRGV